MRILPEPYEMGNPKAGVRRKRVAVSRKAVEEKRGSATGEADVEVRKEKAQRVGDGVLEKQAQGGAGRSARDERYAKRKARTEEGGGGDCGPTVKQAKGLPGSVPRFGAMEPPELRGRPLRPPPLAQGHWGV